MARWDGKHTPLSERFWQKVMDEGAIKCWNWQGAIGSDGYGQIWDGTLTKKGNRHPIGAHRASLIVHEIPNPKNFRCVLHRCNNKLCVNPAHLYWGSNRDNTIDAIRDGLVIPVVPRGKGTEHPAAKLTDDAVKNIRALAARGATHRWLADKFDVSNGLISMIIARKRWGHVP